MRLFLCVTLAFTSAAAQQTAAPGGALGGAGQVPSEVSQATTATPRISGGVMAGQLRTKVPPVYPQAAQDKHVIGSVVLRAIISREGLVKSLAVISGPVALRDAAVDAVKQWTYKPFLLNGRATEVDTTVTVTFPPAEASQGGAPAGTGQTPPALPSLPSGRARISPGVMERQKQSGSMPNFCVLVGNQRLSGTIVLHVVVARTGNVSEVDGLSGPPTLQQSAIEAVRGWTYKPYLLNGDPVEVDTTVTAPVSCGT